MILLYGCGATPGYYHQSYYDSRNGDIVQSGQQQKLGLLQAPLYVGQQVLLGGEGQAYEIRHNPNTGSSSESFRRYNYDPHGRLDTNQYVQSGYYGRYDAYNPLLNGGFVPGIGYVNRGYAPGYGYRGHGGGDAWAVGINNGNLSGYYYSGSGGKDHHKHGHDDGKSKRRH
ncbi:MAG: hypothetical protein UW87_C0042G0005 [Candidatus Moranbacteria bacterium GW2011_GWC2_45_10]|nr:MAG: hypothetical protein UW87_C0042G0005 [Candidatus Moranbacteria bacterium GW2011_GWC2_45_10]